MMNKSKSVFLLPFFLLVFLGCATAPKTAFDREKMNVVNLMGYSNNEVNIQVAKDIWNNKIVVNVLDNTSEYYAVFDLTNPKVVSIVFDSSITDLDYSLELATILSYYAYIINNQNVDNLEEKALSHAKETYKNIIANVTKANPNAKFLNPRNFEQYLESKMVELSVDNKFTFSKK